MNIALFTDCFTPMKNGVVTSLLQLKDGLKKKGHNIFIISVKSKGYENNDPNVLLFPKIPYDMGSKQGYGIGLVSRKKLFGYLKKNKIDIIHTHTEGIIGMAGRKAANKLGIPRVATSHTMWEYYTHYTLLVSSKFAVRNIMRFYYKGVKAIVAPSIKSKNYNDLVAPHIPKYIIPNGINIKKFKEVGIEPNELNGIRKTYGIRPHDKVFIFVGRMGVEKRVENLLAAMAGLLKKNSDLKMLFVGDGPDSLKLKKLSKKLNIVDKVILTGFINWEQMHKLYKLSDIFVSASLSEVNPMTMIEAAMCGLPIIARRDDSNIDLVKQGKNGYLADTDDEIAERAEELIFNNEKMKAFSEYSFNLSKNFTAENHVNLMERLYKNILEENVRF